MKKMAYAFIALALGVFSLTSCGGGAEEKKTEDVKTEKPVVEEKKETTVAAANDFSAGEKIYKDKCQVCHLETGLGVEGAFPPLVNSDYLLEDKVRAIRQVIKGSSGEITVNGKVYNGVMPPQVETDEDAIAVINYVLNTWGNKGGTVTAEDAKKAREMK